MKELIEKLTDALTNNKKEIPLFSCTFDYNKFKESGVEGSCNIMAHPMIDTMPRSDREEFIFSIENAIDLIRKNIDMEDVV